MSFAALCGFQRCASLMLVPDKTSASFTIPSLCGCDLSSLAGGLRSTCVSLLELSPILSPSWPTLTRSERGGATFGGGICCDGDAFEESRAGGFAGACGSEGAEDWASSIRLEPNSNATNKKRILIFYAIFDGRYLIYARRAARNSCRQRRAVSNSGNRLPSCSTR